MATRKQRWHYYRTHFSLFRRFTLSFTIDRLYQVRNDFASRYIAGDGYEIGAQNSPLICKNAGKITYIDYLSREESAQKYNIPANQCVEVDIVADASSLDMVPGDSASFIIANHVLEHCPNPIATMLEWLRILKAGGTLFLTLPNHRTNEFDFEKTPATLHHFLDDHEKDGRGEDISKEHIQEHIQLVDGIEPENPAFEKRYKEILESNLHTHYHVFSKSNVLELLQLIHRQVPIRLVNTLSFDYSLELLFIIEKADCDFNEPFTEKMNIFFNLTILLKQVILFLYKRIVSVRLFRSQ